MASKNIFYKAYENSSSTGRVIVNYELCERSVKKSSYEYVDKVFVSYGGDAVVVDLWNFDLIGLDGVIRNRIGTRQIFAEKYERDGFSEIVFLVDSEGDRFAMSFSSRDKSFRITENSFDPKTATGVMHNRLKVELPSLNFVQGV
jgi:hypothetical protein